MGKRLRQQRRGRGTPAYVAPSHRYRISIAFRTYDKLEKEGVVRGEVISFVDDPVHTALLMAVRTEEGIHFLLAPEGIAIGDSVEFGKKAEISAGNVLPLSEIPDGTPIYNLELVPGDGGKIVRSAGNVAYVISHAAGKVYVSMPSKATKVFAGTCRAQIGVISAGGRLEKPIFKAGTKYYMVKATAKYWPYVRGVAMSPYSHPFGGKEHHAGRPTVVARGTPPGAKVGLIAPGAVGRRKGKKRIVGKK